MIHEWLRRRLFHDSTIFPPPFVSTRGMKNVIVDDCKSYLFVCLAEHSEENSRYDKVISGEIIAQSRKSEGNYELQRFMNGA